MQVANTRGEREPSFAASSSTTEAIRMRGIFLYLRQRNRLYGPNGQIAPGTGYDLADFLLGLPQSTSIRYGSNNTYFRGNLFNVFLQDNWKINSRLTLNLGLRYELTTPLYETRNRIANLDVAPNFTAVAPVLPDQQWPYSGTFPRSLIDTDRNNLAPRAGLAWTTLPPQDHGGAKRLWHLLQRLYLQPALFSVCQPAHVCNQQQSDQPARSRSDSRGWLSRRSAIHRLEQLCGRPRTPGRICSAMESGLTTSAASQPGVDAGLQWLQGNTARSTALTQPVTSGLSIGNRPGTMVSNAQGFLYDTSGASSVFHSMLLRLQRRFTSGLSANGNYVYGKSIDNASSIGGGQETVALIDNNLRAERGLSAFDMQHQFNLNSAYEFPLGERKRFLSHKGLASRMLGDWSLSATATLQSGSPYTARILGSSINNSGTGANQSERADSTGLVPGLSDSERTVNHFFNTAAFALPIPCRFGKAGRNTIIGPGTKQLNLSLNKVFRLSSDGKRLEFRAQSTNVLNTPTFSGLGTVVDSSHYGRLTSAKQMRQFEFRLRVRF